MSDSIDQRLASLEAFLGITSSSQESTTDQQQPSIDTQIQTLEANIEELYQSSDKASSLTKDLDECDSISRNLDVSASLRLLGSTGEGSKAAEVRMTAPYIYRRQEVLAQANELERAMQDLIQIRDLLLISNPNLAKALQALSTSSGGGGGKGEDDDIPVQHVMNAPVFSPDKFSFSSDPSNHERLEKVAAEVVDINDKSKKLAQKCDLFIDQYYQVMNAVNEKFVLYNDVLKDRERTKEV